MAEKDILFIFPKLATDKKFKLTSKQNVNYNCIAWAAIVDNEFWWPEVKPYPLDGVRYKWPFNIENNEELRFFIELFKHKGYTKISSEISNEHPEFRKVALFIKPSENLDIINCQCTHAARQRPNGLWTSKLGTFEDIEHSNPYDLEGPRYGKLAIILKKKL